MVGWMESRGLEELERDGIDPETIESRRSFEMRYADQVHNCLVTVDLHGSIDEKGISKLREAFDRRHEELFTYSEPENTALLVNVHISIIGNASSKRQKEIFTPARGDERPADADKFRKIYLGAKQGRVEVPIVGVNDVQASAGGIVGPAVVEEKTTTIIVPVGWTVNLDILDVLEHLARTPATDVNHLQNLPAFLRFVELCQAATPVPGAGIAPRSQALPMRNSSSSGATRSMRSRRKAVDEGAR